jgi:hypothetical protein
VSEETLDAPVSAPVAQLKRSHRRSFKLFDRYRGVELTTQAEGGQWDRGLRIAIIAGASVALWGLIFAMVRFFF